VNIFLIAFFLTHSFFSFHSFTQNLKNRKRKKKTNMAKADACDKCFFTFAMSLVASLLVLGCCTFTTYYATEGGYLAIPDAGYCYAMSPTQQFPVPEHSRLLPAVVGDACQVAFVKNETNLMDVKSELVISNGSFTECPLTNRKAVKKCWAELNRSHQITRIFTSFPDGILAFQSFVKTMGFTVWIFINSLLFIGVYHMDWLNM
jgi:hypothetical protein